MGEGRKSTDRRGRGGGGEDEEEEGQLHGHFTEMNRLENFLCHYSVGFLSSSFTI